MDGRVIQINSVELDALAMAYKTVTTTWEVSDEIDMLVIMHTEALRTKLLKKKLDKSTRRLTLSDLELVAFWVQWAQVELDPQVFSLEEIRIVQRLLGEADKHLHELKIRKLRPLHENEQDIQP